jgi:hypothetical protein
MGRRKCDSSGLPTTTRPPVGVDPVGPVVVAPVNPPPSGPGSPAPNPDWVNPIDPDIFAEREEAIMLEKVSPALVAEILAMVAAKPMWVSVHFAFPTFGAVSSTELTGPGYRRAWASMTINGRMLVNTEPLRFRGIDVPVTAAAAAVCDAEVGGTIWAIGRFNPPRQLVTSHSTVIGAGELSFRVA